MKATALRPVIKADSNLLASLEASRVIRQIIERKN